MDKTKTTKEMKTSNYLALLVVITIIVLLVGGLVVKSLATSFLQTNRVIGKKNAVQVVLATDVTNAKAITRQYEDLNGQKSVIANSLPGDSDIPGFANALEAMSSHEGVQFLGVSTVAATTGIKQLGGVNGMSAATSLPVTITINSSYDNLSHFLVSLESSSRPVVVSGLSLTGTNAKLSVTINATTYYQAPVTFSVTKEAVQ
jgi:Tfp pilus assembly protein PilO